MTAAIITIIAGLVSIAVWYLTKRWKEETPREKIDKAIAKGDEPAVNDLLDGFLHSDKGGGDKQ